MEGSLVCRLCLYNNEEILPIFGESQREVRLQEKLHQYLNLEVQEDDSLPKLICAKCFQTVEKFHQFYQEVAQNQTVFAYSAQPGMIVISDQNSHTTYILREDQVLAASDDGAGGDGAGSSIKIESIHAPPQVATTSVATGIQYVPLVDSGDCSDGGQSQKVTLVTTTTAVLNAEVISDAGSSELPTYDESQKRKERLHAIAVAMKDSLDVEMLDTDTDTCGEDDGGTKLVSIIDPGPNLETQGFSLMEEDLPVAEALDDDDEIDEEDEDEPEEIEMLEEDALEGTSGSVDYKGFPKKLIQSNRLIIRGKELSALIARFYELTCEICNPNKEEDKDKFLSLDSYVAHCKDTHGIKGYVWCCSQKIFKPRMMALHMARHLQPEAFKCPECGKLMTTPKILQYHIQNHRPEEERPLKCDLCPRRFSYGSALISHSQTHLPEQERTQHVCDDCGKSYSSAKNLSDHVQFRHCKTEPLTYVCHICAKQFSSKSNLTYHLTTHQPKIHQVQCEECKKWLKNKLCLRKHMVQHSMVRHTCNLCDYSAVNLQCLKNHMRVQHTDLKPFSCDVCGKTFKLKNTLLNHQVQHTGVKKFSCEFCSRTFASSGNYYAHRKRMHPQELAVQKKRKEDEEKYNF